MNDAGAAGDFIALAKEHGFWGAVWLGAAALWAALAKRWVVTPGMADLQAENAALKVENALLRKMLEDEG